MTVRSGLSVVVALALLGSGWQASARAADGRDKIREYLDQHGASYYTVEPIQADYVDATFPGAEFFAVLFQRYPITFNPPEGLSLSNVFMVRQGQVVPLTAPEDLKILFVSRQPGPVTSANEAVNVTRAWLRLSEEFVQDGFYTFSDPGAVLSPMYIPGSTVPKALTMGRVAVTDGGQGFLRVEMEFDENGQLVDITPTVQVTPGERPV
jgi:hypothetical protein